MVRRSVSRRYFIGGLTVLPAAWSRVIAQGAAAPHPMTPSQAFTKAAPPITAASQVLDIMEFEGLARDKLPPAHFGYLATGADDDRTVAWNHDAYSQYEIRATRFNDTSHLDMSRLVLGTMMPTPIYLSAVSALRAFHPDGESGVGKAARAKKSLLMLSSGTDTSTADVISARGAPIWQQFYPTDDFSVTTAIIRKAEAEGASAVVLTVDSRGARNSETSRRAMEVDNRQCTNCHPGNSHDQVKRSPVFGGMDTSRVRGLAPQDQSGAFLDKVRAVAKTKLLVKGVVTGEDAAIAVKHGVDGIIVSNHGGRNEETLRATIDCLPEIVAAVKGKVPVLIDGGIRRGTDVFKALALGATAVGVGRPYAWGLAAFGQPGVEAVIDIYNRELKTMMVQAGTPDIASINSSHIIRRSA